MTRRWEERPENSTWGDWGDNDQLGRLNLIGPDQVLAAVSEVRVGKTFCLSLPLDRPPHGHTNKGRSAPVITPREREGASYFNFQWSSIDSRFTDVACDDTVTLDPQYSTHWDSFAHRGSVWSGGEGAAFRPTYYNGFRGGEHIRVLPDGRTQVGALGIETFAEHGVQGRGVMINLVKYRSVFRERDIGFSELSHVLNEEKIKVSPGDLLCFWTGFDEVLLNGEQSERASHYYRLNGLDLELHEWIRDTQISAVVSDNPAIERPGLRFPNDYEGSALPLHDLLLFRLGVPVGELWYLSALAQWLDAHNRTYFLLTAPPLRMTGAVGSPVTPIATV